MSNQRLHRRDDALALHHIPGLDWFDERVSAGATERPTRDIVLRRLVLNMMLVLAEFERERITEGWDATVQNAVARGVWPHSTPFGYVKDEGKRLVPDPINAPYLQGIFERRLTGDTWADIARWLNNEGIKPGRAQRWVGQTVRDLIRNEVYLGVVWAMGYRNTEAHEPLIGKADFIAGNVAGLSTSRLSLQINLRVRLALGWQADRSSR